MTGNRGEIRIWTVVRWVRWWHRVKVKLLDIDYCSCVRKFSVFRKYMLYRLGVKGHNACHLLSDDEGKIICMCIYVCVCVFIHEREITQETENSAEEVAMF